MIVRLACGALQGVDAFRVDLEVDFLRKGMPAFVMVGLAEGAVREAKERVFAAMRSCGFTLPAARITVNLAPADRRKAGSAYDLPLAVALLGAAGVLPAERLEGWFLAGELSLSGAIKPVPGVLPWRRLIKAPSRGCWPGTKARRASSPPRKMPLKRPWSRGFPLMVRRRWTKPYGSSWVNAS